MRRYHFDLVDTNTVTDASGAILDNDDQATKVARKLVEDVREQRPELVGHGYEILVRRDSGEEVVRVAIDLAPRHWDGRSSSQPYFPRGRAYPKK
jgi:hypothetical protein